MTPESWFQLCHDSKVDGLTCAASHGCTPAQAPIEVIVTHHITHHLFIQCQIPRNRKATRFERLLRTEFSSVGQDPHIGSHVSTTFDHCPIERESLCLYGPGTLGRNSAYLAYMFKNRTGMSGPCGSLQSLPIYRIDSISLILQALYLSPRSISSHSI